MDSFFDKLGDVLKSFGDEEKPSAHVGSRRSSGDPDVDAAMDELNDFLSGEKPARPEFHEEPRRPEPNRGTTGNAGGTRGQGGPGSASQGFAQRGGIPEELRQDYQNLNVPFGSPFDKVRAAYKKLLMQYHPDRNADNPEKLRIATEITQKINISYQRIEKWSETKKL
jgi:DnaJ-domain-containing protein 1